jgi:hypothetical protein
MNTLTKEKREATQKNEKAEKKIDAQQIAERAYQLWLERGCENGHDVEDWLRAEEELGH